MTKAVAVVATPVRKPRVVPLRTQLAILADAARMHMMTSRYLLTEMAQSVDSSVQFREASLRALALTTERLDKLLSQAPTLQQLGS